MTVRVLTWNCRRASAGSKLWEHVTALSPDIALLQEVSAVPEMISTAYSVRSARPLTKAGNPQRFQSVMLVRGEIGDAVHLRSELAWVTEELDLFTANLMAFHVRTNNGAALVAMNIYSPAWCVPRSRLSAHDTSSVKLEQNPDVWVADLLVAALRAMVAELRGDLVVGGDFNSCETFDAWKGGPRGNREWLDRMAVLNLTECLREVSGRLTPTFRRPGAVAASSQIDHLFVSKALATKLKSCTAGDAELVYGHSLSDHLPIIADFHDT